MAFYVTVLVLVLLACCLQLLRTRYRAHLKSIPGPFTASISNLWKLAAVYQEDMPGWNIAVHEEYGPVVRIGPDHVSFSSPAAFQAIYTSRQAFPKVCTKNEQPMIPRQSTPGRPITDFVSVKLLRGWGSDLRRGAFGELVFPPRCTAPRHSET